MYRLISNSGLGFEKMGRPAYAEKTRSEQNLARRFAQPFPHCVRRAKDPPRSVCIILLIVRIPSSFLRPFVLCFGLGGFKSFTAVTTSCEATPLNVGLCFVE